MLDKNNDNPAVTENLSTPHPFAQYVKGDLLNLSRLNLIDKDVMEVLRFIQDNPHIIKLDLSMNHIGDQGLIDFVERNLAILDADFSGNLISDMGLAIFGYKNQVVLRVDFSHNLISDGAIMNFAEKNHNCYFSKFSTMRYH